MKLKFRCILEHGHETERVIIDVFSAGNLSNYIVFDTTYKGDNKISNKLRHSYWFVSQEVKKGDVIILYTKKGTNNSKTNADGSISYFYYWGLDSNVWNDDGDTGVLFEISAWSTIKAKP